MFKLKNQYEKLVRNYAENAIALTHTYPERTFKLSDGEINHKTSSMRNNFPLEMDAPVSKT